MRVAATAADLPRLPEALADFHGDHPGIQIGLRQGSATEIVALVAAGAVDVAVLALTEEPAGVDVHPLADEPLRVAVPVDDDLAGDARRRWTRCAGGRSSSPSPARRCARP